MVNLMDTLMINTVADGTMNLLRKIVSSRRRIMTERTDKSIPSQQGMCAFIIAWPLSTSADLSVFLQGVFKASGPAAIVQTPTQVMVNMPLWKLAQEAGPYVRLAGLSGASAVVLGAMGAHRTFPETDSKEDLKKIFETANRFHFLHTLALVSVPLCKRPMLVSTMKPSYYALSDKRKLEKNEVPIWLLNCFFSRSCYS